MEAHSLKLLPTVASDLPWIIALETASYPAEEAASAASLQYRLSTAGEYFRSMWVNSELVGFICGTRCSEFTAASMSTHEPSGECLAIHSVAVRPELRRLGLGIRAVRAYIDTISTLAESDSTLSCIKLIAKAPLLQFYRKASFEIVGASTIEHGQDLWFECVKDLRQIDMVQVDAFSACLFGGNPAAVLFTTRRNDEVWMQKVAMENNLAETAFLDRLDNNACYAIRWFTPVREVDLCGHATLAAAKALYATGRVDPTEPIRMKTRVAGELVVAPQRVGYQEWLEMDFPTGHVSPRESPLPGVCDALRIDLADLLYCGEGPATVPDVLVEITPRAFASLNVDHAKLALLDIKRGLVVTSRPLEPDSSPYSFCSRFFAPRCGIPEDPASARIHFCEHYPRFAGHRVRSHAPHSILDSQARFRYGGRPFPSCIPGIPPRRCTPCQSRQ